VLTGTDDTAAPLPLSGSSPTALNLPPTFFDVQFSAPVNLQQLLFQTGQTNPTASGLDAVFVTVPATQNSTAAVYHPRLLDYNPVTGLARFLMLDAVANGPYLGQQVPQLHLSGAGPLGITDLAGNPLTGNDPSGDYVVPFTVSGPARGTGKNPLLWMSQEPNNSRAGAQSLGVLFPDELRSKVVVQRVANPTASDTADFYSFSVLQGRDYILNLQGTNLPAYNPANPTTPTKPAPPLAIWSPALKQWVTGVALGTSGLAFQFTLAAGKYVVKVGDWTTAKAPNVTYKLFIGLANSPDNPPPLTIGPAPAIRVRLAEAPATPVILPSSPPALTSSLVAVSPFTPVAAVAASTDSGLPQLIASTASTAVVPGSDAAVSILLARVVGPVGIRGQGQDTATEETESTGATVTPGATSPTPLLVSGSLLVSSTGDLALEEVSIPVPVPGSASAREQGPVKPPPVAGSPESVGPSGTAGTPGVETVVVKGMPAKSALEVLFEMGSLRAGSPGAFWTAGRLPDDLAEDLTGFASTPADRTAAAKTRWLDVLALTSLGASLTLGGWCTFRLRRRPAGKPVRICWGGEDSTDFPEF
jgi:hypothetical protein